MARRGRHRKGDRVTPKGTRPRHDHRSGARGRSAPEHQLSRDLARALDADHPLGFLAQASAILAVVDRREDDPFDRDPPERLRVDDLVGALAADGGREATGLLTAVAAMTPDELTAARIRRGPRRPGSPPAAVAGRPGRHRGHGRRRDGSRPGRRRRRHGRRAVQALRRRYLAKAPGVVRALVRPAHAERGVRPALTAETLAAVDRFEPEYHRIVRAPRCRGRRRCSPLWGCTRSPTTARSPWATSAVPSEERCSTASTTGLWPTRPSTGAASAPTSARRSPR